MPDKAEELQQYLSSKKGAVYIGVPENSLRISRVTGLLYGIKAPAFRKANKRIFYERSELDNWIHQLPKYNNTGEV